MNPVAKLNLSEEEHRIVVEGLRESVEGGLYGSNEFGTLFGLELEDIRFQHVLWRDRRLGASVDVGVNVLGNLLRFASDERTKAALVRMGVDQQALRVLIDRLDSAGKGAP